MKGVEVLRPPPHHRHQHHEAQCLGAPTDRPSLVVGRAARAESDVHSDELLSNGDVVFQSILLQNVMSRPNGIVATDIQLVHFYHALGPLKLHVSIAPPAPIEWIKIFQLFAVAYIQYPRRYSPPIPPRIFIRRVSLFLSAP